MPPRDVALDPLRLIQALEYANWQNAGGREGVYRRFTPPRSSVENRSMSVLVPLDEDAPEFSALMREVALDLQRNYAETWTRAVIPQARMAPTDSLKFRRETALPSGVIPWRQGQSLIEAAKATLVAGAKSFMEPARQYSNRFGTFANRYLDRVLMGQTAAGSYIVTALVPTESPIPLHGKAELAAALPGQDVALGREVTASVSKSLGAAAESIAEYRETASTRGFLDNIRQGVSFELVSALELLTAGTGGADVTVEWTPYESPSLVDFPVPEIDHFSFSPEDAPVLSLAKSQLAVTEEDDSHVARGRVHLLTRKEAGGPGVVGIDSGARKYRARFDSDDDYHRAVRAHDTDSHVEVTGQLSREGKVSWLYRARLVAVVDPPMPTQDATLFDP
jgi:hypothetical protein